MPRIALPLRKYEVQFGEERRYSYVHGNTPCPVGYEADFPCANPRAAPSRVKLLMRKRGRLELKRSHLVLPLGRFRICRETKRVDGAQGPSSSSERIVQQQRGGAPQRAASAFAWPHEHSVRSRTRRARGELAVLVLARGVDDVLAVGALQLRLRVAPTAKRGRDRTSAEACSRRARPAARAPRRERAAVRRGAQAAARPRRKHDRAQ